MIDHKANAEVNFISQLRQKITSMSSIIKIQLRNSITESKIITLEKEQVRSTSSIAIFMPLFITTEDLMVLRLSLY